MKEVKNDTLFSLGFFVLMAIFFVGGLCLGYQWCESDLKMKYVAETKEYRDDMKKMRADWLDLYVRLHERAKAKGIEL